MSIDLAGLRASVDAQFKNLRRGQSRNNVARAQKELSWIGTFLWQVIEGALWIKERVLAPVFFAVIWPPAKWIWRKYRRLWDWFVWYQDEFKDWHWSRWRAGVMVALTALFISLLDDMAYFSYDVLTYAITARRQETLYLSQSSEIAPDTNSFNVKGCTHPDCDNNDSIYLRARPKMFNHLWAIAHTGNIFFPDNLSAAVPPGNNNRCRVTSYGWRIKLIMRNLDAYPDALYISCKRDVAPA